jgi:UDP-2,3-diacylglucosamine pyrophosphatase LpxH
MGALSFISDVHIRSDSDHRYQYILKFLDHPKVVNSNIIVLGGDIFDRMIGPFNEYLDLYPEYFEKLENLLKARKIIHYCQGNHDFHLNHLYKSKYANQSFYIHDDWASIKLRDKVILISHGDILDFNNNRYLKYRKVIMGSFCHLMTGSVLKYDLVKKIGDIVEKNADRSKREFSQEDLIHEKNNYLNIAGQIKNELNFDGLLCGHSHVAEEINEKKFFYFNNGFFPQEKKFIHIDEYGQPGLIELEP